MSKVSLLYFTGKDCIGCAQMTPIVDQLQKSGVEVKKVDRNNDTEGLARTYCIMSVPYILVMKDGKPWTSIIGITTKAKIEEIMAISIAVSA